MLYNLIFDTLKVTIIFSFAFNIRSQNERDIFLKHLIRINLIPATLYCPQFSFFFLYSVSFSVILTLASFISLSLQREKCSACFIVLLLLFLFPR